MKVVLLSLLVGCIVEHKNDPAVDLPAAQPHACSADITLDGSGSSSGTKVGPLVVDMNGISVCLHLDATHNLVSAHFAASTEAFAGSSSPLSSVLQDMVFTTLQDGWDVTVSDSQPRTFANLEWNAPLHEMTDGVLWIRSHGATTTTTLDLALFEPSE